MKSKFIHTSDIHLGMKFNNKQFSLKERKKRREELWDTFDEIIKVVKTENISYLFIVGDMTELEYLTFKSLKRIIQEFKNIDNTKIIITCGPSDPSNINSKYGYIDWPENVYFVNNTDSIQKIDFDDDNLCIYSMSWNNSTDNQNFQLVYDVLVDENKLNVLMLHCGSENSNGEYLPINVDLIKNKFDYCALGGKHNYEIIEENVVYSGTPEPFSFDEINEHGMIKGVLEKKDITYGLYPIAKRKFINRDVEIDKAYGFNKILDLIKFSGDTFSNIKDYVKINIKGTVNSDINIEEVKDEARQFFYYIEFEDSFSDENFEDKKYDDREFNILASYKLQFNDNHDRLEKQAYKLGFNVLRKEKVVR